MKILIVEDEFTSRKILNQMLSSYGKCDTVVTGSEAIFAFKKAVEEGKPYQLVCLDIMLPEMSGQNVLKEIREYEETKKISKLNSSKVIMTTSLGDYPTINKAFDNECNGYLVKPIKKTFLEDSIKQLGLG